LALVERDKLITNLSIRVDQLLATQLVDEFISCERRFIQRDWEPAELDGGQFAEIAGRIWYAEDSGNLNRSKPLDDCLRYVENGQCSHAISPRQIALHVAKVLRTTYKFRSQRGAVHVSPTYTPNHMDAKYVIESVRWLMNETLRCFWSGDREIVAKTIRELLQFDVPAVGVFEDIILVQCTDLSDDEELLILLHYSGEEGLSRRELGLHALMNPPNVTKSIQRLIDKSCRQVIKLGGGNYRLTDLGSKRVREELAAKLLLQ